ncbi:hypothetical protein FOMPIDRAFT_1050639 [Fomitopsis schrenkii]|nr:hypothetical protein FOMPIDRAFT_1050639 [Fomitopsis schrenkii]
MGYFTSPISPSSSQALPEVISMLILSLGSLIDVMSPQLGTVAPTQASEFAFSSFSWPTAESFGPDENPTPDDFDHSADPPGLFIAFAHNRHSNVLDPGGSALGVRAMSFAGITAIRSPQLVPSSPMRAFD